MKNSRPTPAPRGAGVDTPAVASAPANDPVARGRKNKKGGHSEIAHPKDHEPYEQQMSLVTDWFFEMWERMSLNDDKPGQPGHEARSELQEFFLNSLGQSLRLALDDKDSIGKQWACKLLADVFASIGKHIGKVKIGKPYRELMKNAAFLDERKRIGKVRSNVLLPASMVCTITKRELKKAGHFRKRLLLLSAIDNRKIPEAERQSLVLLKDWKEAAKKEGIPEAYWPLLRLPEFSEKHLPKWWKFLWPIIQTYLPKDSEWYPRQPQHEPRKRYFYDSEKTAHDHLETLARQRDEGVSYLF